MEMTERGRGKGENERPDESPPRYVTGLKCIGSRILIQRLFRDARVALQKYMVSHRTRDARCRKGAILGDDAKNWRRPPSRER